MGTWGGKVHSCWREVRIAVARRGEKCTVKMIFIDWLVAAAVRLHYELKAQVRALRRRSEQIKWSATNRPVLRVQLGEQSGSSLPPCVRLTGSFIINLPAAA